MRERVSIPLRWADLDAYNHVNNVEIVRLLEEARVRAFWQTPGGSGVPARGADEAPAERDDRDDAAAVPTAEDASALAVFVGGADSDRLMLMARQEIEYLSALGYRQEPVSVDLWVSKLGGASLDVSYEVRDEHTIYARAVSTLVIVDAHTGRPRRLTDEERERLAPLVEAPVALRRG